MARRKKIQADKSKPFTTINLMLPVKISVCGDLEMQNKWKQVFETHKNEERINKSDFILDNIREDLNVKNNSEIFNEIDDSRRWDNKKIEGLVIELGHGTIQSYLNFILDRELEKREKKKVDEQKKRINIDEPKK